MQREGGRAGRRAGRWAGGREGGREARTDRPHGLGEHIFDTGSRETGPSLPLPTGSCTSHRPGRGPLTPAVVAPRSLPPPPPRRPPPFLPRPRPPRRPPLPPHIRYSSAVPRTQCELSPFPVLSVPPEPVKAELPAQSHAPPGPPPLVHPAMEAGTKAEREGRRKKVREKRKAQWHRKVRVGVARGGSEASGRREGWRAGREGHSSPPMTRGPVPPQAHAAQTRKGA